jgi:hypothetical protein
LGSKLFIVPLALGGMAPVCLQERSNARDWDALEGYSQVEPEEAPGRRARTVSRQRFSAWFWHAIRSAKILRANF